MKKDKESEIGASLSIVISIIFLISTFFYFQDGYLSFLFYGYLYYTICGSIFLSGLMLFKEALSERTLVALDSSVCSSLVLDSKFFVEKILLVLAYCIPFFYGVDGSTLKLLLVAIGCNLVLFAQSIIYKHSMNTNESIPY